MANKLISQLTAGAANLQDTDQIEGQKNGESITKRFTGLQMRAVEKAEREAQDNVIEASAGLETDGTLIVPATSWGLRAGDYAAGCTDRSGATGALTENILNGLRLLDARIYELGNGSLVVAYMGLDADTTLTDLVPAGYMLEYCIFEETTGQAPILDLGTAAGGNQVFLNQALQTSDLTVIMTARMFSLTATTTLYLNDDDASSSWDGATVDAYFVMKPIIAGGTSLSVTGTLTVKYYTGAYGFSSPPTEAEMTAVIGAPALYPAWTIFEVNDTVSGFVYHVGTDGVGWYYLSVWTQLV